MARAFGDPDERRRMGEAGSAAVAGLTWDRSAALLLAVYEQVIAETRSEPTS
jgi:glycosyltransferase involved in cell wall biosynthesis